MQGRAAGAVSAHCVPRAAHIARHAHRAASHATKPARQAARSPLAVLQQLSSQAEDALIRPAR
jgi:hypothetical protein